MTAVAETTAGGRQRPRRSLLRNPRAKPAESLFPPETTLGLIERVVREHGPASFARLLEILDQDEGEVLKTLHAHPMLFLDAAGRWACIKRLPPEFLPVEFTDAGDLATAGDLVSVVCPACGRMHRVLAGHARKIALGARSARCDSCFGYGPGPAVTLSLGPLPPEKFELYARWWLGETGLSDTELRDAAFAFGCRDATVEGVAAWRARLAR